LLRRLLPPGDPATTSTVVVGFDLRARAAACVERPYVILNMISTADGRASIGGRTRAIGGPADRELFHGLRAAVDAVMVGAGTLRVERYGRIIRDQRRRRLRQQQGLDEEPLACVVSRSLALPGDIPLLAEPSARVVILTSSEASLPDCAAQVEYVRSARQGTLDLRAALATLRERFAVTLLLCEGGPHLNALLLAAGLADELFLTLSPKLAGGDGGDSLRILAGPELQPAVELALLGVLGSDSEVFLRYGVCPSAPESVSRETTPSSSLDS
jgi:riboflavin-specific deaminase-like protein